MPTPSGRRCCTDSKTRHGTPIWCRVRATLNPPMPPPATRTGRRSIGTGYFTGRAEVESSALHLFLFHAPLEIGGGRCQLPGPGLGAVQQRMRPFTFLHPLQRPREHRLRMADEDDVRLAFLCQRSERAPGVLDDVRVARIADK